MITRVSMPVYNNSYKYAATPAFGMAKMTKTGRQIANMYGYHTHSFLDPKMYTKPSVFDAKSALAERLDKHEDFAKICIDYGCTQNGENNAKFIRYQILSPKSQAAINRVADNAYSHGILSLYYNNYDNPFLSAHNTAKLLQMAKDFMDLDQYTKAYGMLDVGTVR